MFLLTECKMGTPTNVTFTVSQAGTTNANTSTTCTSPKKVTTSDAFQYVLSASVNPFYASTKQTSTGYTVTCEVPMYGRSTVAGHTTTSNAKATLSFAINYNAFGDNFTQSGTSGVSLYNIIISATATNLTCATTAVVTSANITGKLAFDLDVIGAGSKRYNVDITIKI